MAGTSKTIMEMSRWCLDNIESYLECEDISKVVQINRSWNVASKLTADDMSKLKELFLRKKGNCYTVQSEEDVMVLKHFGGLISRLDVDYMYISKETIEAIDSGISQHCSDSLESIELSSVDYDTMANISKPFANVTYVSICGDRLSENLSKFNRWFPKMNKLHFQALEFEKLECLEQNFPNLKHLSIDTTSDFDYGHTDAEFGSLATDSNVKIMLHLNPQLESLELNDNVGGRDDFGICLSPKFLSYVARKLLDLRELTLTIDFDYESSHRHGTVHFNHLTSLKMFVYCWSYLSKISIKTKGPLDLCLDSDSICPDSHSIYENIAKFTKKMTKNLKSLTIRSRHGHHELYAKYLIDFISSCEHLESYNIEYNFGSRGASNAIIYFLINCKQIKKFTCQIENSIISEKERAKVQQRFIDEFNEHEKTIEFDAADWIIEFNDHSGVSISKRN